MAKRIFYKVLDEERKSCRINMANATVQYEKKKWVKPQIKNSPLLVFRTILDARRFAFRSCSNPDAVWKCRVKNPKKIRLLLKNNGDFISFWASRNKKEFIRLNDSPDFILPEGTYGADEVKIIEEITNDNNK